MENNLYKKLRFFALCLAIICMILSLLKKVKANSVPADEMQEFDNSFYNYINDTFGFDNIKTQIDANNIVPDNTWNYIELTNNARNHTPAVILGWFTNEPEIDISNMNFADWTSPYSLNWYTPSQRGNSYDHVVTSWSSKNIDWQNVKLYFFVKHWDSQLPSNYACYLYKVNLTNRTQISYQENKYAYAYNVTYDLLYREKYNNFGDNDFIDGRIYINYMNGYSYKFYNYNQTFGYYNSSSYWFGINTFLSSGTHLVLDHTPDVNTDGFKVFKTTRSGRDYLIFDGLNAIPINIRNGNWYLTDLISTLGFTVKTETGSYDYSYSFDIDDASEEFPYNSDYFMWQDDWGNLYLRWEIPIDELNLPDDSYGYTENVIMTVSNNVSINNVTVPYLGQFMYITPVYLYGTQEESGLINPDNAPAPVIPENPITQEDKVKNYNSLVYGTLLNKSTSEYESWINGLHDGILYNQIVFTQLNAPTLQDLFSQFPDMISILNDVISYTYGIQGKNDFLDAMETYIEENAFSQYVDYLVFVYNGNDADHNNKFDFYIFETAKGRQKAISFLLDTSNTYFDKQFDVLRNSIPYIKNSIDRIDTNLFNLGEDIFSQNNSIIANLISIDNKFNDLQDLLKNLFNKLFDNLNNLHLSQLDAIDNKLSNIVSAIQTETPFNEDDTIAESIAYYQSHTQAQAVLEDKYSVWFTGYCHFWLQEYGEEEPINNTRSTSRNVTDFASSEKRHILFRTFKVITNIYDKMQEDLLFNRVEEMFDYFLNVSSDVSHTRRSYFYDVFDEQNTPTLDYNPYE